jgi:hypothetical protein
MQSGQQAVMTGVARPLELCWFATVMLSTDQAGASCCGKRALATLQASLLNAETMQCMSCMQLQHTRIACSVQHRCFW